MEPTWRLVNQLVRVAAPAPTRAPPLRHWALLGLSACAPPAELSVAGLDGYGEVGSAVWMVLRGDTTTRHRLLLSSGAGACGAWQEAASTLSALDVGPRDDCAAFQGAMADVGAALDEVAGAGATTLELDLDGSPTEGAWSTPDPDGADVGPTFTGRLRRYQQNPYTWASTQYDCDDPDPLSEYTADLVEDDAVSSATLDLSMVGVRSVQGTLSGDVSADGDGDLTWLATIDATARWARCTVEDYEDPVLAGG